MARTFFSLAIGFDFVTMQRALPYPIKLTDDVKQRKQRKQRSQDTIPLNNNQTPGQANGKRRKHITGYALADRVKFVIFKMQAVV